MEHDLFSSVRVHKQAKYLMNSEGEPHPLKHQFLLFGASFNCLKLGGDPLQVLHGQLHGLEFDLCTTQLPSATSKTILHRYSQFHRLEFYWNCSSKKAVFSRKNYLDRSVLHGNSLHMRRLDGPRLGSQKQDEYIYVFIYQSLRFRVWGMAQSANRTVKDSQPA